MRAYILIFLAIVFCIGCKHNTTVKPSTPQQIQPDATDSIVGTYSGNAKFYKWSNPPQGVGYSTDTNYYDELILTKVSSDSFHVTTPFDDQNFYPDTIWAKLKPDTVLVDKGIYTYVSIKLDGDSIHYQKVLNANYAGSTYTFRGKKK